VQKMGGELQMNNQLPAAPRHIRRNGLQAPYDPLQIVSWCLVAFLAGSFCGLLAHMLPSPVNIIVLVVYVIDLVVVLGSGFETGRCDPIDPFVLCPDEDLEGRPELLKCGACVSRVNKLSRHCLICDKCVVDYDHHCKWLNNCIGAANYRSFICLISSTLVLVGLQFSVSVYLLAKYVSSMDGLQSDLDSSVITINAELYFVVVCANVLLGLPSGMMVAHLVGFHIYLANLGLTTYNYVMKMQAEEEAAKRSSEKYLDPDTSTDSDEVDSDDEALGTQQAEVDKASPAVVAEKLEKTDGPNHGELVTDAASSKGVESVDKVEIPGAVVQDDGIVSPSMAGQPSTAAFGTPVRGGGGVRLPPLTPNSANSVTGTASSGDAS